MAGLWRAVARHVGIVAGICWVYGGIMLGIWRVTASNPEMLSKIMMGSWRDCGGVMPAMSKCFKDYGGIVLDQI